MSLALLQRNNGPFCFDYEERQENDISETLSGFEKEKKNNIIIRKKERQKGKIEELIML